MSPIRNLVPTIPLPMVALEKRAPLPKPTDPDGLILESWAQGYMVGSLIIMAFITTANMRRGILLHKLILLELLLGIWQGFWLFFSRPTYAWWLSVGAIFLNASWSLHNVISWMKIKPFLSPLQSKIFIGTVILAQPYWVVEIYANFAYFHGHNKLFEKTRPWEALCRDPWWILTTVILLWTIKTQYDLTAKEILKISPRFGIMLASMMLSIIFIILDILSVLGSFGKSLPVGINPFWKLAFVFKCLTDMIVLDDFKTALDRLRAFKLGRLGSFAHSGSDNPHSTANQIKHWERINGEGSRRPSHPAHPSPDNALLNASYFPASRRKQNPASVDLESGRNTAHKDFITTPEHNQSDANLSTSSHSRPLPEDMGSSASSDPRFMNMDSAHIWNQRSQDSNLFDIPRHQGRATRSSHDPPYGAIAGHNKKSASSTSSQDPKRQD